MPDSDSGPAIPPREEFSATGGDSESPTPVPLLPTPPTEASFQFNQQNIQQIPQSALDRLSPEQLTGLLESTLLHTDKLDERRFKYAMDLAAKESRLKSLTVVVGDGVAVVGFAALLALTYMDNDIGAGIVATFLATIIRVRYIFRLELSCDWAAAQPPRRPQCG